MNKELENLRSIINKINKTSSYDILKNYFGELNEELEDIIANLDNISIDGLKGCLNILESLNKDIKKDGKKYILAFLAVIIASKVLLTILGIAGAFSFGVTSIVGIIGVLCTDIGSKSLCCDKKLLREVISLVNEKVDSLGKEEIKDKQETFGEVAINETKNLGNAEIEELINNLRSKILLLPDTKEHIYLERVQKALSVYMEGEKNMETMSNLNMKMQYKLEVNREIKKTLEEIDKDIDLKELFVNKEDYKETIDKVFNSYLVNMYGLSDEDKVATLSQMMHLINNVLNGGDLSNELYLKNRFAECFWETYYNLGVNSKAILMDLLLPTFKSSVILFGEKILNNMEQTLEVISMRSYLNNLREKGNLEGYLRKLGEIIDSLRDKGIRLVRENTQEDNQMVSNL